MSDRLAISAALSILLMSIYVLFGADAVRVTPSQSEHAVAAITRALPEVSLDLPRLLAR